MLTTTSAVVLQTYRYSETSKIVRLATRDLGVQSAIAKGALRANSRFGASLELLSEGEAQLYHRDTRELQTLAAFDLLALRRGLAGDLGRFAGAAMLAETMLRMAPAAPLPAAYDTLVAGLDALERAAPTDADAVAVRALWQLVGVLGFAPSLDACVKDGVVVAVNGAGTVAFSAADGGVLCDRCASPAASARLPVNDYRDLVALNDPAAPLPALDAPHAAAHRRLVARFARHRSDTERLPALEFWERRAWPTPAAS